MGNQQLTPSDVGIDPAFLRRRAPELARDIVCGLDAASKLAATYGLTPEQWAVLKTWPAFRQMVAEANEELSGSAGTLERARRKAALAIAEVGVHDMAVIMGDAKVSARDRINAFAELREIAGIGGKPNPATGTMGGMGGYGPLIQIVMPNGTQLSVGEAPVEPSLRTIEGEATRIEGPSNDA